MADIAKIIEEIKGMTVLELSSLVKAIEEEFGVSAAAPAEEKTEFNILLKEIGANKIGVIKVVKEALGLGLVEAKGAVEKMGVLKEAVAKEEADKIIEKLKEAGATAVAE